MSIKTTHEIKRDLALEAINSKLQDCTNGELSDILETLIANDFYNFTIVEEFEEPFKDDGNLYYSPRIEYLSQLPEKYN